MNRAAQVHVAIGILSSFEGSKKPVADMLRDWGRKNRFAGSKDRAAIAGVVFETLRTYKSSAYLLDSKRPRSRVLGALWQYFKSDTEKCAELFDGSQYGPDRLNEGEMHKFETADLNTAPLDIRADFPKWLYDDLRGTFGSELESQVKAFCARAPLDIRINPTQADRDGLMNNLADLNPVAIDFTPHGIRFEEPDIFKRLPNLENKDEFSTGVFEIQDGSSQICAAIAQHGLKEGGSLLDYCAGAGGKSLAIAASRPDVKITATDRDEKRLKPLSIRAARAGVETIEMCSLADVSGTFDRVLLDAPCSGSGTWRRKPEAKWRLSVESLKQRRGEQKDVLFKAKDFLSPGGVLIYATCSILDCENRGQVREFLEKNADFELVNWRDYFPGTQKPVCAFEEVDPCLQLSPLSNGSDGFFISILKKKA